MLTVASWHAEMVELVALVEEELATRRKLKEQIFCLELQQRATEAFSRELANQVAATHPRARDVQPLPDIPPSPSFPTADDISARTRTALASAAEVRHRLTQAGDALLVALQEQHMISSLPAHSAEPPAPAADAAQRPFEDVPLDEYGRALLERDKLEQRVAALETERSTLADEERELREELERHLASARELLRQHRWRRSRRCAATDPPASLTITVQPVASITPI